MSLALLLSSDIFESSPPTLFSSIRAFSSFSGVVHLVPRPLIISLDECTLVGALFAREPMVLAIRGWIGQKRKHLLEHRGVSPAD